MRTAICPKCGAAYELHPLNSLFQELCPACRNEASWDNIRHELASAGQESGRTRGAPAAIALSAMAVPGRTSVAGSIFTRENGQKAVRYRLNPFGGNTLPRAEPGSPARQGRLNRIPSLGRVEFLSEPPGRGGFLHEDPPSVRDIQAEIAPVELEEAAPSAEPLPQMQFAVPMPELPVVGAGTGKGYGISLQPLLLANADAQAGLSLSWALPAEKPGLLQMPDTCGG